MFVGFILARAKDGKRLVCLKVLCGSGPRVASPYFVKIISHEDIQRPYGIKCWSGLPCGRVSVWSVAAIVSDGTQQFIKRMDS